MATKFIQSEWETAFETFARTKNRPTERTAHEKAFEIMLQMYRPQIDRLASNYATMGGDPMELRKDLASVGTIAFWTNINRVGPAGKRNFSVNMCNKNVASQMLRFINQHARAVSTPEWIVRLISKVHRKINDGLEIDAAIEEVAGDRGHRAKKNIRECLHFASKETTVVSEGDRMCETPSVSPFVGAARTSDAFDMMSELIEELPAKQAEAIKLYYGFPPHPHCHTYREAGKIMELTHERVRQLVSIANQKLRAKIKGTKEITNISEILQFECA